MFIGRILLIAIIYLIGISPVASYGYVTWHPSYSYMYEHADLVIIASPVEQRELDQPAVLPGVTSSGKPIPAVEIETTFEAIVVMKGGREIRDEKFLLVHYRKLNPPRIKTAGPSLINFELDDGNVYLMFLKNRKDGRLEALMEIEPGFCIEKLAQRYEPE